MTPLQQILAEADRQKGTIKVEVKILKPDLSIVRPEMSAKITFLAAPAPVSSQPVVTIPKNTAVISGSTTYVWIVRDGFARRIPDSRKPLLRAISRVANVQVAELSPR